MNIAKVLLLVLWLRSRAGRYDDDDDGDDGDGEPSFKERIAKIVFVAAASQFFTTAVELVRLYLKMEKQSVGNNIKVEKLSPDEIMSRWKPFEKDADFVSKGVVRETKHPAEGNYILVDFHDEDATFNSAFLLAGFMRWKRTTPDEAIAVWLTGPSPALWEPKPIVCSGMIINRKRAHVVDLTTPFMGFGKEKNEKFYGVGLCDYFEPIGDRKILFRVK